MQCEYSTCGVIFPDILDVSYRTCHIDEPAVYDLGAPDKFRYTTRSDATGDVQIEFCPKKRKLLKAPPIFTWPLPLCAAMRMDLACSG
jgi:hypothetical protein